MTDIHDIKPALYIGAAWGWLPWAMAALVLAAAALVWWRRRRRRVGAATAPPLPNAEQEALAQLDALSAVMDADGRAFYFKLSDVLRRYIERRFGIPAAEMTLEELLPGIDRLSLPVDLVRPLKSFCRAAEPIKFAGAPADAGRMPRDLVFVRKFVERTAPIEDANEV